MKSYEKLMLKTFIVLAYLLGISGIALMIFNSNNLLFIFLALAFTFIFLGVLFSCSVWWNYGGKVDENGKPIKRQFIKRD